MFGETTRNTTLICSSDNAQVIRIKSQFLIPKLTKSTMKEFLRYAKTKAKLIDSVVKAYDNIQRNIYKSIKVEEMLKLSPKVIRDLSNRPTHEAVEISIRQSIDAQYDRTDMKKKSKGTSSMPSLNSFSQLPENYEIPHVKENNILDSTLQNLSNLFTPKKIGATFLEKSTFISKNSISKIKSKVKDLPFTFGSQTTKNQIQTSISNIKIKRNLSKIKHKYKSVEDFKPFSEKVDPIEKIAKLKLQK